MFYVTLNSSFYLNVSKFIKLPLNQKQFKLIFYFIIYIFIIYFIFVLICDCQNDYNFL